MQDQRHSGKAKRNPSSDPKRRKRIIKSLQGGGLSTYQCEDKNIQERGIRLSAAAEQLAFSGNGLDLWTYKL
jgi:hypothetical protein